MTLPDLLDELEQVDPETYRKWFNDYDVLGLDQWQLDSLQGCIQRACEKREGWEVSVWWKDNKWVALIRLPGGYTNINQMFAEESDSPAEALLAVYVAAVEMEKR